MYRPAMLGVHEFVRGHGLGNDYLVVDGERFLLEFRGKVEEVVAFDELIARRQEAANLEIGRAHV